MHSSVSRGLSIRPSLGDTRRKLPRRKTSRLISFGQAAVSTTLLSLVLAVCAAVGASAADVGVAVGAQYDSTHVYVSPADLDAFVNSFVATFGGKPSKRSVENVLPVPSQTEFQYLWTPIGTLSIFAFQTPIPYPFGQERTGYLVSDMDQAIKAARAAGPRCWSSRSKIQLELTPSFNGPAG